MTTTRVRRQAVQLMVRLATVAGVAWIGFAAAPGYANESQESVPVAAADEQSPAESTQAAPPANARPRLEGIEEIIISARKRDENLQDTPISVSAFTGSDLEERGISRIDDIGRFAPNLQFEQAAFTQSSARIQIRGIGSDDPIANRDPGVGLYLDGVYLARAQGALLGLADIERVEVLRGPQGTLFGRNTIGGAVSIISTKPSADEFSSEASVRLGNYNLLSSRLSVNLPLVPERAAVRASFQTTTRDGYTSNRLTGKDTDDRRLLGGRIALRLNPTDSVELMLTGEQTRQHETGRGGECRFSPEAVPFSPLFSSGGADILDFQAACEESDDSDDELRFVSPVNSNSNTDTWGLTSTLSWEVVPDLTFKSISAWRRQENSSNTDFSFARVNVGNVIMGEDQQDQVTQEFNLGGSAFDEKLVWTTGLFGIYEKTTPPGKTTSFVAFDLCELTDSLGLDDETVQRACDGTFQQRSRITTFAYALYGQFTYKVTDRLRLTGGLRRSLESKQFKQDQQRFVRPTVLGPSFETNRTDRFDAWTPLVNLSFDVSDSSMVYATYSKGFKSGGFNGRPSVGVDGSLAPFEQEILNNYEIGLKSSFFDNRLIANFSAFYGIYDDIQQTILTSDPVTGAFASNVINAAEAKVRGAEIELRAVPVAGLDLSIGLGFTNAEYEEFEDLSQVLDPATGMVLPGLAPRDRSDEEFFNVPSFTGSFSAAYTLYDLPIGDLTARATWSHQNKVTYGLVSDTVDQGKRGLLSGRLGLQLPDGKTEIALFGENLLDRRYINGGINFEDGFAVSLAYFGPPRMYGIEIRRQF